MSISQNFPNTRPSLNLNFARSQTLDPRITFTRTTTGTRVGPDGLIEVIPADQPRFDFDPTTGESLGLLVEESRANLVQQSEDLTSWLTTAATKIYDAAAVAPDGTLGVWIGANASGTGLSSRVQPIPVSYTAGTVYTFSVFCKAKEVDTVAVFFNSPDFGYKHSINYVNLNTGAVGGSNPQLIKVEPFPNGWYRISASQAATASATNYLLAVSPGSTGDVNNLAGNGVDGIYIWGAQLEEGSFPTSYIPTTTSAVTRAADVASITGTNFSSWYRQDEGTVFYDGQLLGSDPTVVEYLLGLSNGTINNFISIIIPDGQNHRFKMDNGGVNQVLRNTIPTADVYNPAKVAYAFRLDDTTAAGNGTVQATDTLCTVPTVDRFVFGSLITGEAQAAARYKRLTFWPQRLPNETLQGITQQ